MKKQHEYDSGHWDGTEAAEQEIDPTPLPGSHDHHEKVKSGQSHIGGVGDGHRGRGLAHNHTADLIGENSADEMSDAADTYLDLLKPKPSRR